jgi:hypothetical protein
VKLVKCSPTLMLDKLGESQLFLSGISGSIRVAKTWKMMKE